MAHVIYEINRDHVQQFLDDRGLPPLSPAEWTALENYLGDQRGCEDIIEDAIATVRAGFNNICPIPRFRVVG